MAITAPLVMLFTAFKMVVIPVQFQDTQFSSTETELEAMVSLAEDYFNDQLASLYSFSFDLAPIVTLSNNLSYYGANYSDRYDALLYEAVREACNLASGDVDFSLYDNDADGQVDNVFLIAAGFSEADGAGATYIYPQSGNLRTYGASFSVGGKVIDSFSVACELTSDAGENPRPAGIGIFCHELAHYFGLPDLYDTDGAGSGGETPGLWNTSLMDNGCQNADGTCPPNLNAIEHELLGLGTCETLQLGEYTLEPINLNHRYLRFDTSNEGEYFLFECRSPEGRDAPLGYGGLLVYHIDKSSNSAGESDYYGRELTAAERWEYGQINCRPDRQCAEIITADPEATDFSGLFFPYGSTDNFGSDTSPAFRSWSGESPGIALTSITRNADGSVSFKVVEPVIISSVTIFQDAVILNWVIDEDLENNQGFEIEWTGNEESGSAVLPRGTTSYTIEGLEAQTNYKLTLSLVLSETEKFSATYSLMTKVYRSGTYPYIYLSGTSRNADGSFVSGARIPLRVFNATDVEEVLWFLDDTPISVESDGYYTIVKEGRLKAEIYYEDGTREIIVKTITIK